MNPDHPANPTMPRLSRIVALFLLIFGGLSVSIATAVMADGGEFGGGAGVAAMGTIIILLAVFLDRERIRNRQLGGKGTP